MSKCFALHLYALIRCSLGGPRPHFASEEGTFQNMIAMEIGQEQVALLPAHTCRRCRDWCVRCRVAGYGEVPAQQRHGRAVGVRVIGSSQPVDLPCCCCDRMVSPYCSQAARVFGFVQALHFAAPALLTVHSLPLCRFQAAHQVSWYRLPPRPPPITASHSPCACLSIRKQVLLKDNEDGKDGVRTRSYA